VRPDSAAFPWQAVADKSLRLSVVSGKRVMVGAIYSFRPAAFPCLAPAPGVPQSHPGALGCLCRAPRHSGRHRDPAILSCDDLVRVRRAISALGGQRQVGLARRRGAGWVKTDVDAMAPPGAIERDRRKKALGPGDARQAPREGEAVADSQKRIVMLTV